MALHHGTYLDLPPQRRLAVVGNAERHLREQLADPTLSEERRAKILSRAQKLGQWIAGTLEVIDPHTHNPDGSLREDVEVGIDHEVEISEEVVIEEG